MTDIPTPIKHRFVFQADTKGHILYVACDYHPSPLGAVLRLIKHGNFITSFHMLGLEIPDEESVTEKLKNRNDYHRMIGEDREIVSLQEIFRS